MDPTQIVKWAVDAVVALLVIGLILWIGSTFVDGIQAPANLNAAIGNNHALAAEIGGNNKAVDGLKTASDAKTARSVAATKIAGEPELAAAKAILATPASGTTPLERAANRINAEFAQ